MNKIFSIMMRFLAVAALISVAAGCGGDGGGSGGGEGGSVEITTPASGETCSTSCSSITLSGSAFISSTWWACCSGTAEEMSGVTVTWRNEATGETGKAFQSVRLCGMFSSYYPCEHTWSAVIPLALGSNRITVTAVDPSSIRGQDIITVNRPSPGYSISGRACSQSGGGLYGVRITLTNADATSYCTTGADGSYSLSCVVDGSYTLTPGSTVAYAFSPQTRTVTVSGGDVAGQDFTAEAYALSGTITALNGPGSDIFWVEVTGQGSSASFASNQDGTYAIMVPNGTYTVIASACSILQCVPLTPASRTVTVDHADVSGLDFQKQ